ncbi:MAG: Phosphatidylglycerophosphatase A [candidate division BRC1 bacterium ADurb.BinA364]|nr:MAG: Phosphatidylglycerophosphatase A [candidate division BRC1 bacterium ADurb.BinA364]
MRFCDRAALIYASGFGAGYSPIAPGTAGSAAAIPLYFLAFDWLNRPGWAWAGYLAFVALWFAAGVWASSRAETLLRKTDPGFVCIDEVVGYFLCVFALPNPIPWHAFVVAFFVFRLFDIWKPEPIDRLQRLHGGLGIMIDDLLAGVYTCLVLQLIYRIAL